MTNIEKQMLISNNTRSNIWGDLRICDIHNSYHTIVPSFDEYSHLLMIGVEVINAFNDFPQFTFGNVMGVNYVNHGETQRFHLDLAFRILLLNCPQYSG